MSFYQPIELPKLMVSPNGSRKMKKDHPAVPLSISEIVNTAKNCYIAGADAIHFHVRDKNGLHVLDSGLYKEALAELEGVVPEMHLQITTEAVGRYTPEDMRKLAYDVSTPGISIGIREMIPSFRPIQEDIKIYQYLSEKGVKIQHILYGPEDVDLLAVALDKSGLSKQGVWCLFVIGHYTGKISSPSNIQPFLDRAKANDIKADWAICAFGKEEVSCIKSAIKLGGKIRVGFENSIFMPDGKISPNNETKVKAVSMLFN